MRALIAPLLDSSRRATARLLPLPLCAPLGTARARLRQSLDLAFRLAAAHNRPVALMPTHASGSGRLALHLPEGVAWGRPDTVPLPPALAASGWLGGAPQPITVLPRGRAASNVWFLHHGREALCLTVGLSGQVRLFRYRPRLGAWTPC